MARRLAAIAAGITSCLVGLGVGCNSRSQGNSAPTGDDGGADVGTGAPPSDVTLLWAKKIGPPAYAPMATFDPAGNVDVAASGGAGVDLGQGQTVDPKVTSFVAQLDTAGSALWWTAGASAGEQQFLGIAADPAGNVVTLGTSNATVAAPYPCSAPGAQTPPVLTFLSEQAPVAGGCGWSHWGANAGDAGAAGTAGVLRAVTDDFSGNCIVGGSGVFTSSDDGGAGAEQFLREYDSNGRPTWSVDAGGPAVADRVGVDTDGDVYVLGANRGDSSLYVAKYSSSGAMLWTNQLGGQSFAAGAIAATGRIEGLAVDSAGDVALTGDFQGTVNLGGGQLTAAGGVSFFVAVLDASGTHRWSHAFAVPQDSSDAPTMAAPDVVFGPNGETVIAGTYWSTLDFGGGPLPPTGATAGDRNVFFVAFDANGSLLWSHGYGQPHANRLSNLAADGSGNVLLAGTFTDAIDFGSGALTTVTPSGRGSAVTTFLAEFSLK
jgi:hypothetical protein